VDVVEPAAAVAAEVLVRWVGVGIVEDGAPALDHPQEPRLHQRGERVVHGRPRQLGQIFTGSPEHLVGGEVPVEPRAKG
jgi:hypothetical protein